VENFYRTSPMARASRVLAEVDEARRNGGRAAAA